jgi:hypothetical protein
MTVTKRKNPHKNKQQQQQQEPANPLVRRLPIRLLFMFMEDVFSCFEWVKERE